MKEFEHRFKVGSDDPAFEGHFPDHPLLPGAALLARILAIFRDDLGLDAPLSVPRVKFLAPVMPGDDLTLKATVAAPDATAGTRASFALYKDARLLLQGTLIYNAAA